MKNFTERLNYIIEKRFRGRKVELAKALDVDPGSITHWVKGERRLSKKTLRKLREIGINPDWLIAGEGEPFLSSEKFETSTNIYISPETIQFVQMKSREVQEKQAMIEYLLRKLKELETENEVLKRQYQDCLKEIEKYKQKISELESGVEPTKKVPLVKVSEKGIAIEIKGKKK
ncbi:XRE family transcriptional regulator [Bacteroidetes/Chlorobi group bacterium Naka2016]|jgi:transcriptional regulator with XRE-family HTH domain|nr:MAG: XRE family transcriptional regulator [Bacteroidetes/Chlorobi group bacterium Naka2016]